MALHVHNTLSQRRELFTPVAPANLKMYVCGPTVYNYIHIGNARVFVFFDVVRRYLRSCDYEVLYVQNFTDFDDRLLASSLREGVPVREIANRYIEAYFEDMDALGVERADVHPRASDHVEGMIEAVRDLLAGGAAYISGGDVYFRAQEFPGYGKLAHQPLEELRMGARIEPGDKKENAFDFALWKASPRQELGWETPWGYGRPGWHIECSVMVRRYLGDTIDIHAGGEDLCFPHHENERAQSESWTGEPFVRYWLHNAFVMLQGEKMAKSVGNTASVVELREKYDPLVLRYLLLSVHYRRPLQFSEEALVQAVSSVGRLREAMVHLRERRSSATKEGVADAGLVRDLEALHTRFMEAMDDDFHTANAISVLFAAVRLGNRFLCQGDVTVASLEALDVWFTRHAGEVLGLLPGGQMGDSPSEEIQKQIDARRKAREAGNFVEADAIRTALLKEGIALEDTPQGVRWKRV
ncbi:cysteine--tRNA ligase [Pasteuria penetrans]|uniref:cysteine--tRNA ligase n=1 Tax=Pasteuria penetrans TaxID=86005 RepID=UPI000F92C29F|nr:cysteine--tRNA ligase [Pasteuria penetrans]